MTLPAWLSGYAFVKGEIKSAPLDLVKRMDKVYAELKKAGWNVVVKSIGTDFSGPLGLPVPRSQPLELYLMKRGGPFTLADAKSALQEVLERSKLNYSMTDAWLKEIKREVLAPTLKTLGGESQKYLKFALIGAGIVLAIKVIK